MKSNKAIKLTGLPKQDAGSLMAFSLGEGSTAALFAAPLSPSTMPGAVSIGI